MTEKRYGRVPKIYNVHPNVRRAYRDYKDELVNPGFTYVPKRKPNGDKASPDLADELYVLAVGCNWKPTKIAYGPKKGFEKIGVLVARKPSPTSKYPNTVALSIVLHTQVNAHYAQKTNVAGAPSWFVVSDISDGGRRKTWDNARLVFQRLWPGQSLVTDAPISRDDEKQRVLPTEAPEKSTPPVQHGDLTVVVGGVTVTGSRDNIRALLFDEE